MLFLNIAIYAADAGEAHEFIMLVADGAVKGQSLFELLQGNGIGADDLPLIENA